MKKKTCRAEGKESETYEESDSSFQSVERANERTNERNQVEQACG